MAYPEAMTRLLAELERLPGVGPRTAERLAHHLLRQGAEGALPLARAIEAVVASVRPCGTCGHLADRDPCPICADPSRDRRRILVVEQPRDLEALERAGWRGVYHVLHGSLRADGGSGEELALEPLRRRIEAGDVDELVLGTDPDFEGDGTALRITELVRNSRRKELPISRLARGVPTGSAIEYTNPAVLAEALSERRALARPDSAEEAP
ncbi:MAG: recombination protein RecR [Planctomycetes bacterium]|nr:recombination protein RecR [Planctomycetota bacterium]